MNGSGRLYVLRRRARQHLNFQSVVFGHLALASVHHDERLNTAHFAVSLTGHKPFALILWRWL
jgi:hypothetical protein